jgi:hypothetical protein
VFDVSRRDKADDFARLLTQKIDDHDYTTIAGVFSSSRVQVVPPTGHSAGVFISYRREDEPSFAGRLYDRLVTIFGARRVFFDINTIELGLDFGAVINEYLSSSKVLLVVIGKNWISAKDPRGQFRLSHPDDFVRLEIETGLLRGIPVIPVLVDGAVMPSSAELPRQISQLARRNGITVTHANFNTDVSRLIATIDRTLNAGQP